MDNNIWRPIKTAPIEDDTLILGAIHQDGEWTFAVFRYYPYFKCWQVATDWPSIDAEEWYPTYWMPLPDPPAEES